MFNQKPSNFKIETFPIQHLGDSRRFTLSKRRSVLTDVLTQLRQTHGQTTPPGKLEKDMRELGFFLLGFCSFSSLPFCMLIAAPAPARVPHPM